ncbi:MAG: hypothetical protein AAFU85_02790 [Planctomycetota bacterium]
MELLACIVRDVGCEVHQPILVWQTKLCARVTEQHFCKPAIEDTAIIRFLTQRDADQLVSRFLLNPASLEDASACREVRRF